MLKICKVCGNTYKWFPSVPKMSCSRACTKVLQKQAKWKKYKQTCSICGTEFLPKRPAEGGTYCSYTCRGIADRKEYVERGGYVCKLVKHHPKASKQGYVFLHNLIMEEHLGHYVEEGYVVHHIDHDKKNNDISNLQYMTSKEHKALHMKLLNVEGKVNTLQQRNNARKRMFGNTIYNKERDNNGRFKQTL